jgi:hypothetical protein
MQTTEHDFERLYQQAYYRHSGFGPQRADTSPDPSDEAVERGRAVWLQHAQQLAFAGVAVVMFVVPAVAAALVV